MSRAGFILSTVGAAMGLGNLWRFSFMDYDNGRGTFLLPYSVALLTGHRAPDDPGVRLRPKMRVVAISPPLVAGGVRDVGTSRL